MSPGFFFVAGRGSVKRSNTCAVWADEGAPVDGGPQSVFTVLARGCRTRSVKIDSKDARVTGCTGSCSLAFANARVVPSVSWACVGIGAGGLGIVASAKRVAAAFGTDFGIGAAATVFAGGKGGANADGATLATSFVPLRGANATARAVSKSCVSLPYTSPMLRAWPE